MKVLLFAYMHRWMLTICFLTKLVNWLKQIKLPRFIYYSSRHVLIDIEKKAFQKFMYWYWVSFRMNIEHAPTDASRTTWISIIETNYCQSCNHNNIFLAYFVLKYFYFIEFFFMMLVFSQWIYYKSKFSLIKVWLCIIVCIYSPRSRSKLKFSFCYWGCPVSTKYWTSIDFWSYYLV